MQHPTDETTESAPKPGIRTSNMSGLHMSDASTIALDQYLKTRRQSKHSRRIYSIGTSATEAESQQTYLTDTSVVRTEEQHKDDTLPLLSTTSHGTQKHEPPTFLTLPLEIRLQIYELASSHRFGRNIVKENYGRLLYRLTWPSSPLDYRNPDALQLDAIASVNRQTRQELVPRLLRGYVVKFPAWTPEFKLQCLYWIGDVSETFCRSIDWFWLEGLYWRFSVQLTGSGEVNDRPGAVDMKWEDERARISDVHRHAHSETFVQPGKFILRVDCTSHIQRRASAGGRRFARTVEKLLEEAGGDGRLGKEQVMLMLNWAALAGGEQMRELEEDVEGVEGGVSIIHDPGRFWLK